jgi:lipopolysaccharide export system protein LptA
MPSQRMRIKKITATGHIKVNHDQQYGKADHAIYDALAEKVHFWGHVVCGQNKDVTCAEKGTWDMKHNRLFLQSSQCQPINMLIYPNSFKKSSLKK